MSKLRKLSDYPNEEMLEMYEAILLDGRHVTYAETTRVLRREVLRRMKTAAPSPEQEKATEEIGQT